MSDTVSTTVCPDAHTHPNLARSEKREVAEQVGAKFVSFDDLISKSDVVIIVCALNETTKDLFNKEVFARMKSSASIINVARGGIIVQEDLIEALKVCRKFNLFGPRHCFVKTL